MRSNTLADGLRVLTEIIETHSAEARHSSRRAARDGSP